MPRVILPRGGGTRGAGWTACTQLADARAALARFDLVGALALPRITSCSPTQQPLALCSSDLVGVTECLPSLLSGIASALGLTPNVTAAVIRPTAVHPASHGDRTLTPHAPRSLPLMLLCIPHSHYFLPSGAPRQPAVQSEQVLAPLCVEQFRAILIRISIAKIPMFLMWNARQLAIWMT